MNVSNSEAIHIASPGYPDFYPSDVRCEWILHSDDQSGSYLITFIDFIISETEAYSDLQASEDYFAIGKGRHVSIDTQVIRLSKFVAIGSTIVLEENEIWMEFFSDFLFHNRGFLISVRRRKNIAGK